MKRILFVFALFVYFIHPAFAKRKPNQSYYCHIQAKIVASDISAEALNNAPPLKLDGRRFARLQIVITASQGQKPLFQSKCTRLVSAKPVFHYVSDYQSSEKLYEFYQHNNGKTLSFDFWHMVYSTGAWDVIVPNHKLTE